MQSISASTGLENSLKDFCVIENVTQMFFLIPFFTCFPMRFKVFLRLKDFTKKYNFNINLLNHSTFRPQTPA